MKNQWRSVMTLDLSWPGFLRIRFLWLLTTIGLIDNWTGVMKSWPSTSISFHSFSLQAFCMKPVNNHWNQSKKCYYHMQLCQRPLSTESFTKLVTLTPPNISCLKTGRNSLKLSSHPLTGSIGWHKLSWHLVSPAQRQHIVIFLLVNILLPAIDHFSLAIYCSIKQTSGYEQFAVLCCLVAAGLK